MKKTIIIASSVALMASSCVSLTEFETLQTRYDQTEKQYLLTKQELAELKEENSVLTRQNQALNTDMSEMALAKNRSESTIDSLTRRIEQMRHHYDTTMENYVQEVAGKSRDLNREQNLLTARTRELNDKERELQAKEAQLAEQQEAFLLQRSELLAKQQELADAEARARRQVEAVRNSVTQALVGFADKGLNVETKDGKVYVSMDNKLLFPSASWSVSKDGASAIQELARVLEADTTLNVMVEGHTDNDPYRGSTAVKDNWDLSVMRATAIVKLLLQHGKAINPARIEACGHGEFAPKVANDSPQNKAINRRTEIIITPDLDALLRELGN